MPMIQCKNQNLEKNSEIFQDSNAKANASLVTGFKKIARVINYLKL